MNTSTSADRNVSEDCDLTVISIDIEQFSHYTDAQGTRIATTFRNAVERAFERTGLAKAYAEHAFLQNGGDGIVAGFHRDHLPHIVDGIPSALQGELRKLHQEDQLGVRMRMGISFGPVLGIKDRRVDVSPNRTIIDACRIADSDPTRLLLENSDREVTFLAVAVTAPVMDFTVDRNQLRLRKSEFVEAHVSMEKKKYKAASFLHVPSPSGQLLRSGLANMEGSPKPETRPPLEERVERSVCLAYEASGTAQSGSGQVNQIGRVEGDVRDESIKTGDVSGQGAFGVVTGGTVNQDMSTNNSRDSISAGRDATINNVQGDQNNGAAGRRPRFRARGENA